MQYPLISEYIEAIRSAEDNFDQYNALRPVLDDKGNPVMSSGNFAVVFKMQDENSKRLYAVKCFTRDQERRHENYRRIAEELEFVSSPYLVHFRFLEKELFVDTSQGDAEEYPVLVMDWVEGEPLDRYLRAHLQDTYALQLLAYRFCRMGAWLLSQPFAHGDLKPDNILVKSDGSLVLVDYDGMFVPAMQGEQAGELGSPDFRHPLRTAADFNEHIDDFSIASIALSLKAIALQPSLYDQFVASDRLLFAASNYMDLGKSALLPTLCSLTSDAELATLLSIFLLAHAKNSLGMISFRLFLLQEPEKPKVSFRLFLLQEPEKPKVSFRLFLLQEPEKPKVEVLRTDVTDEDRKQAIKDEYGVWYSPDGLRLIKANLCLNTYKIKDGTKVICDEAFSYCKSLTSIQLPESVTSIGDWAFSECKSLTSIQLPGAVTSIGNLAFSWCESLTSIQLPKSVKSIGDNPFRWCKQIHITCDSPYFRVVDGFLISKEGKLIANLSDKTHITIPESVNSIGDDAFSCCESLTSIQLPEALTSIGNSAFWGCDSLTSIQLPHSVNSIGNSAFSYCKSLTSIQLPESVTSIGYGAFSDCTSLTSILIPESVNSIGDDAFYWCNSLTSIYIPKGTMKKFKGLLKDKYLINKLVEE
ncbi:MAG: leucine-rich repeat protein [Parabacteroides sp.]|nr:leucine-rich repeat protein [Parabacteroides sp.]